MGKTDIDFVITWVDGSDPAWLAEKNKYAKTEQSEDWTNWGSGDQRFRDWDLLKYWFRSIEQNAPWVHKIHFVTWGHCPEWLNTEHPRINIVRHDEYIPKEFLPTFNSHVIELNLHRIKDLAEQFVYFNDDTFLIRQTEEKDFFINGLPKDFAGLNIGYLDRERTSYNPFDAMMVNRHFNKNTVIKEHFFKWFYPFYGVRCLLRNVLLLPFPQFAGFQVDHLPMNLLKSTFDEIWNAEEEELRKICRNRFRCFYSYSPWLIRDWQRVKGNFIPQRPDFRAYFKDDFLKNRENITVLRKIIQGKRRKMICINDECKDMESFEFWKQGITEIFRDAYPQRSSFEK